MGFWLASLTIETKSTSLRVVGLEWQYGDLRMLILTRRVGETLMIGDDVSVTVLGVKGNQVRLGINAPKNVAVHREEIYERIRHEQNDTVLVEEN